MKLYRLYRFCKTTQKFSKFSNSYFFSKVWTLAYPNIEIYAHLNNGHGKPIFSWFGMCIKWLAACIKPGVHNGLKSHIQSNFKCYLHNYYGFQIFLHVSFTHSLEVIEPISEPVLQMALELINNHLISVKQKR